MQLDISDLLNVPVEWREDPDFYQREERYVPRHRWCRFVCDRAEDRNTGTFNPNTVLEHHTGTVIASAPGGCVLVSEPALKALHVMPADCVRTL